MKNREIELFKERYYFEHERNTKLTTKLGIPITILTIIFGVITYFLKNIINFNHDSWSISFYISLGIILLCVALTIYYLIRSYYNYTYAYFPTPQELSNDIENIKNYYKDTYFEDYKQKKIKELIENDIDSLILNYYKECSEINVTQNDRKSKYLHKSSSTLIVIIIFLFLSSIPFYKLYYSNSKIQKIEIINSNRKVLQMTDKDKEKPKDPPSKPKPSGIRQIKEGEEKPKKK